MVFPVPIARKVNGEQGPAREARVRTLQGREALMVVVIGLVLAALATGVASLLIAGRASSYTAHAQVVLVATPGADSAGRLTAMKLLGSGRPARTAATVLAAPASVAGAARAAHVEPAEITVAAAPVAGTGAVTLSVVGRTPAAAESTAQALLDTATAQVLAVSGPFELRVLNPPGGSATSGDTLWSLVLVAVATAAMVLGCAGAVGVRAVLLRRGDKRVHSAGDRPAE